MPDYKEMYLKLCTISPKVPYPSRTVVRATFPCGEGRQSRRK